MPIFRYCQNFCSPIQKLHIIRIKCFRLAFKPLLHQFFPLLMLTADVISDADSSVVAYMLINLFVNLNICYSQWLPRTGTNTRPSFLSWISALFVNSLLSHTIILILNGHSSINVTSFHIFWQMESQIPVPLRSIESTKQSRQTCRHSVIITRKTIKTKSM